jgi:HD-GYP domain-containing protein (c-di-GMP phosphodiesterase class II)
MWQEVGPLALALVLMPLFVARWAMGKFAAERDAYQATIGALVKAVETKDAYTRGHSERVARASVMIARRLAMNEDRLNAIEYAGTLHDVGKLGVPTAVLTKAGKLTDDEFDAIKTHPVRGHEIVREIEFLDEALNGIFHHHERMDGRGYPAGLSGYDIPEFARIIAVADAFDSMTSTRSYRNARPVPEAVEELQRCKGTQFDPVMVEAMVAAVEAEGWVAATPPTADELAAQTSFSIDDDDPLVDVSRQAGPR